MVKYSEMILKAVNGMFGPIILYAILTVSSAAGFISSVVEIIATFSTTETKELLFIGIEAVVEFSLIFIFALQLQKAIKKFKGQ